MIYDTSNRRGGQGWRGQYLAVSGLAAPAFWLLVPHRGLSSEEMFLRTRISSVVEGMRRTQGTCWRFRTPLDWTGQPVELNVVAWKVVPLSEFFFVRQLGGPGAKRLTRLKLSPVKG